MLNIIPANTVLPSDRGQLTIFDFLVCGIEANFTLGPSTVESRWILPDERILPVNGELDNKYQASDGPNGGSFEALLIIERLIYSDANNYTCGVRDIRDAGNRGPWISAQVSLQLEGNHGI